MRPNRPLLLAALCLPACLLTGQSARAENGVCAQPDYSVGLRVDGGGGEGLGLDQKITVEADSAQLTRGGVSQLAGSVHLRQGDKEFNAENVDFEDATQRITVNTESVFTNPQLIIRSQKAEYSLADDSGSFTDSDYVLPTRKARGSSERIVVDADGKARLYASAYTTCAPDSDAWYIEASEIKLDQEEGLGTARNARLRFGGVPILYSPWVQFPIDDRRRTGLLYPTIGNSDRTGFDLRWPVYLNLGPNYDATVTPRYMSRRGLQIGTAGRYLLKHSEGVLSYDYLPDDRVYHSENNGVGGSDRSLLRFDHVGLLSSRLGLEATYSEASDTRYFEDLGGTFASASTIYLERSARLTYQAPDSYRLQALVQGYQTIENRFVAVDDPYKRLPQVKFDALTRNAFFDTRAGLNAEYVNFVREDSVQGQRINLQPYLRYLHDENAWYVTSQLDWDYTQYLLTDTAADQKDDPSRSLPVASGEAGLRFERVAAHGEAIQTLEPRAFALYVPYKNQDNLPVFDTGEPDFDFVQLFARNRFYGEDRVADAANVAGALTTRWIDAASGETRWTASIGQLYRIETPRVELVTQNPDGSQGLNFPAPDRGATNFIGEVTYNFLTRWSAAAVSQWSPEDSEFQRANLGLRYRDLERGKRLDLAYRYRRDLLEQADVIVAWPVSTSWRVAGRTRYSIRDEKTLENFVGLTYETCCWALSGAWRRYIATRNGNLDSGIYFQLELKGLTRIGTGYSALFPKDDGDDDESAAGISNSSRLSSGNRLTSGGSSTTP
ncbi:LPS-assembly protein LptD [Hydrocarboniphaga effusa]|nr:LPS assembly protein LptD [Hydrocarboniphaga effusa]